jgi:hypothetical protein
MLFRKIATILLLTFLFFNWVGYWLCIAWVESRETAGWKVRTDKDQYSDSQLILFKVSAAALPYSNSSADFEKADGEIKVGDIHYRYVRKRLYNDSLEFLCLPCQESNAIRAVRNDMIRQATGIPDNGNHGRSLPAGKASQVLLKAFWYEEAALCVCKYLAPRMSMGGYPEADTRQGHTRIGKQPPRNLTTLSALSTLSA